MGLELRERRLGLCWLWIDDRRRLLLFALFLVDLLRRCYDLLEAVLDADGIACCVFGWDVDCYKILSELRGQERALEGGQRLA